MTSEQLDEYLDQHQYIEWRENGSCLHFRNNQLQYYKNDPERCTAVKKELLFGRLTPEELHGEINRGLQVRGISRVTGYFSIVEQWNDGKRGELRDRKRYSIDMPTYEAPSECIAVGA